MLVAVGRGNLLWMPSCPFLLVCQECRATFRFIFAVINPEDEVTCLARQGAGLLLLAEQSSKLLKLSVHWLLCAEHPCGSSASLL